MRACGGRLPALWGAERGRAVLVALRLRWPGAKGLPPRLHDAARGGHLLGRGVRGDLPAEQEHAPCPGRELPGLQDSHAPQADAENAAPRGPRGGLGGRIPLSFMCRKRGTGPGRAVGGRRCGIVRCDAHRRPAARGAGGRSVDRPKNNFRRMDLQVRPHGRLLGDGPGGPSYVESGSCSSAGPVVELGSGSRGGGRVVGAVLAGTSLFGFSSHSRLEVIRVAFRSAKEALLSRSERRLSAVHRGQPAGGP